MKAVWDLPLLKFKIAVISLLLLGDICGGAYFYGVWINSEYFFKLLEEAIIREGVSLESVSEGDKQMIHAFVASLVGVCLLGVLLFHIILHIFLYRGKKTAWFYYKYYSFLAALCCGVGMFINFHIFFVVAFLAYTLGTVAFFKRPYESLSPNP